MSVAQVVKVDFQGFVYPPNSRTHPTGNVVGHSAPADAASTDARHCIASAPGRGQSSVHESPGTASSREHAFQLRVVEKLY